MVDSSAFRSLDLVGLRGAYGALLADLADSDTRVHAVTMDTSSSAGLGRFASRHPDRFWEMGIAEQNAVSVSAGMAVHGLRPFVSTFAPFLTLRAAEQIKVHCCYMKSSVVLVGLAAGLVQGKLGFTHSSIEELGLMRALPGMEILIPSDARSLLWSLERSLQTPGPVYIRLTGGTRLTDGGVRSFPISVEGTGETAIIACGPLVTEARRAAATVEVRIPGGVRVIELAQLSPLPVGPLARALTGAKSVLIMEEHVQPGGVYSAVCEHRENWPHIRRIQAAFPALDSYPPGLPYGELLSLLGLAGQDLEDTVVGIGASS